MRQTLQNDTFKRSKISEPLDENCPESPGYIRSQNIIPQLTHYKGERLSTMYYSCQKKKKRFKLILIMRGKNRTNPDCGTFYRTTSLDSKHFNFKKKKKERKLFQIKENEKNAQQQ